jgi:hypothetical protein
MCVAALAMLRASSAAALRACPLLGSRYCSFLLTSALIIAYVWARPAASERKRGSTAESWLHAAPWGPRLVVQGCLVLCPLGASPLRHSACAHALGPESARLFGLRAHQIVRGSPHDIDKQHWLGACSAGVPKSQSTWGAALATLY